MEAEPRPVKKTDVFGILITKALEILLRNVVRNLKCLIYEMLFIQEKKPELNTQSDSIKAKPIYHPLRSIL